MSSNTNLKDQSLRPDGVAAAEATLPLPNKHKHHPLGVVQVRLGMQCGFRRERFMLDFDWLAHLTVENGNNLGF